LAAAILRYDISSDIALFTCSFTSSCSTVDEIVFSYNGQSQLKGFDTDTTDTVTMGGPDNLVNLNLLEVTGAGSFDLGSFLAIYTMSQGLFPNVFVATSTAAIDFPRSFQPKAQYSGGQPRAQSLVAPVRRCRMAGRCACDVLTQ
jgi:hypothetical protein